MPLEECPMCHAPSSSFSPWGIRLSRSQGKNPAPLPGDTTLQIKKCSNCDLLFPDPMPVPFSPEKLYDMDPEKYWRRIQMSPSPDYFSGELSTVRKYLGDLTGKKMLDIGSGLGFAMKTMEQAGMEVYGVEPSPAFRQQCIQANPQWENKILPTTANEYQAEGKFFDFINFGAVLEHLSAPGEALLHALDHLSPGGIIHAEVPNSRWLVSRLVRIQYQMRGSKWVMNLSPMHAPFHLYEFSKKSFQMHAQKHGYHVREIHIFNTNSYLPGWADKLIRPVMKLTSTGIGLKVWLRKD